ncbi:MAG: hypothetical protein ACYS0K_22655 [Planctomycetota bacterium]|jgi:hypothetical protein
MTKQTDEPGRKPLWHWVVGAIVVAIFMLLWDWLGLPDLWWR